MLRRVFAAVGLVLFLGAFAWLADRVFRLGPPDPPAPPAAAPSEHRP